MNKYFLLFGLALFSVSCEKSDWFSPEDVNALKINYENAIVALNNDKNSLTTQVTDLTTQVTALTSEVEDLEASVSTLTASNTTLTSDNDTLTATNATQLTTIAGLNDDVTDLTSQVTSLTADVTALEAEIVTLETTITNSGATNTELTDQITTLTASVTTLEAQIVTLQADITTVEGQLLAFKNFKSLRDKLDVMVAATITDTNLNAAIDSISIGLTSTSLSPTVLDGLISTEANWLFNNAIKTGTTSMTAAVSSFYDTSADTNVVNFRTLVTELTAAWNAAKETTLIAWFIEFIKEYENL